MGQVGFVNVAIEIRIVVERSLLNRHAAAGVVNVPLDHRAVAVGQRRDAAQQVLEVVQVLLLARRLSPPSVGGSSLVKEQFRRQAHRRVPRLAGLPTRSHPSVRPSPRLRPQSIPNGPPNSRARASGILLDSRPVPNPS